MDETRKITERRGFPARLLAPRLNRWFLPRILLVALVAWAFFTYLCIPSFARGKSMEPSYADGSFLLCWRPAARNARPGDVVMVRLAGPKVMYLKRLVAVAGDTVEFRDGALLVNGVARDEPYVKSGCDWNLAPFLVPEGKVYVVGDNRGMAPEEHRFGAASVNRIMGVSLW